MELICLQIVLLAQELTQDKSKDRITHILGRYEGQASEYYKEFRENDEYFKELSLKRCLD